mmetsp:Transcript_5401/g.22098  ORF Transcript_5401/g.22098 Transcript_5401/m.22098 type:complete len:273 (+) Transcript_5401:2144-2962(+)
MAFTSPCRCRCSIHVSSRRLNSSCKPRPASAMSSHTALDPLPKSASISTPSSSRLGQHTALHTRRIISGSDPSADWTSSGGGSAQAPPRPAARILGRSPLMASAATSAISRLARPTTSLAATAAASYVAPIAAGGVPGATGMFNRSMSAVISTRICPFAPSARAPSPTHPRVTSTWHRAAPATTGSATVPTRSSSASASAAAVSCGSVPTPRASPPPVRSVRSGSATATSRTVGDRLSVSIAASSASTSAGESIQYPGPSTPGSNESTTSGA